MKRSGSFTVLSFGFSERLVNAESRKDFVAIAIGQGFAVIAIGLA
jgi:hypothetical protein